MTWDEARTEFLTRKTHGEDPLMLKQSVGPQSAATDDFTVLSREEALKLWWNGKRWENKP